MSETVIKPVRFPKEIVIELEHFGINSTRMRELVLEELKRLKIKKASKQIDKIRAKTKYGTYNSTKELIEWRGK